MRVVTLISVLATASPAAALEDAAVGTKSIFGLGMKLGEPTAVTGKLWLNDVFAVDLQAGYAVTYAGPRLGVDALFHFRGLASKVKPFELAIFVGVGGGVGLWYRGNLHHIHEDPWRHSHTHDVKEPLLFFRALGGAAMMFRKVPVEVFAEAALPTVVVSDGLRPWNVGGAVGARYYF